MPVPAEPFIAQALGEMRELYLRDATPWVVGFSGGKDSSTVVQLTYRMLMDLPPQLRHKQVHVIASDTLVESPVVEGYLDTVLHALGEGAARDGLPLVAQKVVPDIGESFWVMLLGRGYPSPNRFFRWCTERLKINPTTRYIQEQIDQWGSAIILLGARKAESSSRAQVLENYRTGESLLRRHATMPQAFVYAPIADWPTENVWTYLTIYEAPWNPGLRLNSRLRELYRDGAGGECPLVIDKTTPSCGQSRFGCWTCTVVNVDSSMEGFLEVGGQYEWMRPLLEFRNKLKLYRDDPQKREKWRRASPDRPRGWSPEAQQLPLIPEPADACEQAQSAYEILGPFKLDVRVALLTELLSIQKSIGHPLISPEEIELVRRYWTEDYRVDEETMLDVLERVFGPAARRLQLAEERRLLRDVCAEHSVDVLLVDRLLDLERGYVTKLRKRGLFQSVDKVLEDWLAHGVDQPC